MEELDSGKRSVITEIESELAREYTQSLLPNDIRYPKEGDIYTSIQDYEIDYMTAHNAPYTGGGKSILPKGESIKISKPISEKPIGVYCDPINYDKLHDQIVSKEDLENPYYSNYYFSIDTVDLNKYFKLESIES